MFEILLQILKDGGTALFSILHTALPLAVFVMFFWLYGREHGWKQAWRNWWSAFRRDSAFRKMFLLVFYASVVLGVTLFSRTYWERWPLRKLWGHWGLHLEDGSLYLQNIENVLLFLPLPFLLFVNFPALAEGKSKKERSCRVLSLAVIVSACLSLGIEASQFLFRKGTVQISDLFFNILGGLLGGALYLLIPHSIKKEISDFG